MCMYKQSIVSARLRQSFVVYFVLQTQQRTAVQIKQNLTRINLKMQKWTNSISASCKNSSVVC